MAYLGARFRIMLDIPDRLSDMEAGKVLLDRYILVHLKTNEEKFVLLIEMISKLYRLANDEIAPDNPDSLMSHVPYRGFSSFVGDSVRWTLYDILLKREAS